MLDPKEVMLRDEWDGPEVVDVVLPEALKDGLRKWNDRYQSVTSKIVEKRRLAGVSTLIGEWDRTGLSFAERVVSECPANVEVGHYGEGFLRYLSWQELPARARAKAPRTTGRYGYHRAGHRATAAYGVGVC